MNRSYIAIDLKSFYASVECVERGLDPLTTNLVVADASRTEKTICLAVSPSLKAHGISGRARLFEVNQRLREINQERRYAAPGHRLTGKSVYDGELKAHPEWAVDYIAAPPRMACYMRYSGRILKVYMKYVAPEDIHVYSIDEVFIDVTGYLKTYRMTASQLAARMVLDVLHTTGITATAGIGTNIYLCKVAMDILAKHAPADKDGVRMAELDEISYRRLLWNHRPLTDFWSIGHGIAGKLAAHGLDTMGKVARCSLLNEKLFYRLFGVNAELLIDHAWGWEPCTIQDINAYRPTANSLSSGQVLSCPYEADEARVVVREMADAMSLDMVRKHLTGNQLVLTVNYDSESLRHPKPMYDGPVSMDYYGRSVPKPAHGSISLGRHTSSSRIIGEAAERLFDQIIQPNLLIRRLNITMNHVVTEEKARNEGHEPVQLDLFRDYEAEDRQRREEDATLAQERRMQEALLGIKQRFGKNAILKGLNLAEGATARERNNQIGGHKA